MGSSRCLAGVFCVRTLCLTVMLPPSVVFSPKSIAVISTGYFKNHEKTAVWERVVRRSLRVHKNVIAIFGLGLKAAFRVISENNAKQVLAP